MSNGAKSDKGAAMNQDPECSRSPDKEMSRDTRQTLEQRCKDLQEQLDSALKQNEELSTTAAEVNSLRRTCEDLKVKLALAEKRNEELEEELDLQAPVSPRTVEATHGFSQASIKPNRLASNAYNGFHQGHGAHSPVRPQRADSARILSGAGMAASVTGKLTKVQNKIRVARSASVAMNQIELERSARESANETPRSEQADHGESASVDSASTSADASALSTARQSEPKKSARWNILRQHIQIQQSKKFTIKNMIRVMRQDTNICLPRGGVYVKTKVGSVQMGIPPETIKDSCMMGLQVPQFFIVPRKRFNLQRGMSVCEIEFPAFFNFFVLKRSMALIVDPAERDAIRDIFDESLEGPKLDELFTEEDYGPLADAAKFAQRPDHWKEILHFKEPRPPDYTPLTTDSFIKFICFEKDAGGRKCVKIGDDDEVTVVDTEVGYQVWEGDTLIAEVEDERVEACFLPKSLSGAAGGQAGTFKIPDFGVTTLGNSHGFDAAGSTSGFVLWIYGQGVMVDPPPWAGQILQNNGIPVRSISTIILTHIHADHDAGTFQQIVKEGHIHLMTTKTILQSFIRKYKSISGFHNDLLGQMFKFKQVHVEQPMQWQGGLFRFFYALHALPCIGFEVTVAGKSFTYSADTFYDPDGLTGLVEKGVISEGRRAALMSFPWRSEIVFHEAGVPPIHTPLSAFEQLPAEDREHLHLIHIGGKAASDAVERGFRIAQTGMANTIVAANLVHKRHCEAVRVLMMLSGIELFQQFDIHDIAVFLDSSDLVAYSAGDVVASEGVADLNTAVIVVYRGELQCAKAGEPLFKLTAGNTHCELQLIEGLLSDEPTDRESRPRQMSVTATTEAELVLFNGYAVRDMMMRNEGFRCQMVNMGAVHDTAGWKAIEHNSILRKLSAPQKSDLLVRMTTAKYKAGDSVWDTTDHPYFAVLILTGVLKFQQSIRTSASSETPAQVAEGVRRIAHMPSDVAHEEADGDKAAEAEAAKQADEPCNLEQVFKEGAFICDLAAMAHNKPHGNRLFAEQDATVLEMAAEDVSNFVANNPGILLALLDAIILD